MLRYILRRAAGAAMDRKGVTAAEYAILAVGIVIIVGAAGVALKKPLADAFRAVGTEISNQQSSITAAASN
ncbi:MAG: hypothetical protein QJR07_11890 [Acetobacteraceae bacterium]|nr:hypothetical protein [Acetobacteraceae bacterium]